MGHPNSLVFGGRHGELLGRLVRGVEEVVLQETTVSAPPSILTCGVTIRHLRCVLPTSDANF
jgi:hypothetical protein